MKDSLVFIFIFFNVFLSGQELENIDGIYVEKQVFSNNSNFNYSQDNITYKPNLKFIYDYYIEDNDKKRGKFSYSLLKYNPEDPMVFTELNKISNKTIDKLIIDINNDTFFLQEGDSSLPHTLFKYDFVNAKDSSLSDAYTGLIDNRMNVWVQPPRTGYFKILQLNPYPFVNLIDSIKDWGWYLEVDKYWSDSRWLTWEKPLTINFKYVRDSDTEINTSFGTLVCKKTIATGTIVFNNQILKTSLKSYYHSKYGFIKLEYNNVDGSAIILELIEIKK